jgi:hypothetical protein
MVWQKRYSLPGASPGTLEPIPEASPEVRITAIHYTPEHYTEEDVSVCPGRVLPLYALLRGALEGATAPRWGRGKSHGQGRTQTILSQSPML